MSTALPGIVTNGVVVPSSPLPEGARVNIHALETANLVGERIATATSLQAGRRLQAPQFAQRRIEVHQLDPKTDPFQ